jgi:hypothetical protein
MVMTPIMNDSIEKTVQSSKYSRTTLAKKQVIHVTHICSALRLMRAQSNTFDGEIFGLHQTHNCLRLPLL